MSQLSINALPTDVIIEIFKRIDRRSLKNAAMVCKLWKEVIDQSCKWSIVIKNEDHYVAAMSEFLLKTNRKFDKIQINCRKRSMLFERIPISPRNELQNRMFGHSSEDYEIVLNFMKTQRNSIRTLVLRQWFPDVFYKFVLTELRNMHSLHLMVSDLPEDTEFYHQLETNTTVTRLVLENIRSRSSDGCRPWFKELVWQMPQITELTLLEDYSEETILFIANNFKKLKKLSVNWFCDYFFAGATFPNLNCLNIKFLDNGTLWNQFTKDNSKIKELTIYSLVDFPQSKIINKFLKQTTENLKLHTLRIGEKFKVDRQFFYIIRKNCPNLKILDLPAHCSKKFPRKNIIPGLRFHDDNFVFRSNGLEFGFDDEHMEE